MAARLTVRLTDFSNMQPSPVDEVRDMYDQAADAYAQMMEAEIGLPVYADVLGRLQRRIAHSAGPLLDTACGSGHMLSMFRECFDPDRPLVGVDLSPRMVAIAQARLGDHAAGIAAKASQRDKIERLARYVSRPPVSTERLSLTRGGNVRYALKTPYRDGTTHVIFEPEEFMAHIPVRHPFGAAYGRANRQSCRFVIARLVALVPKPRAHLTRYHGVFAPASCDRARIVPGTRTAASAARGEVSVSDRQRAMSWAQRLRRVFAIDIETCRQ